MSICGFIFSEKFSLFPEVFAGYHEKRLLNHLFDVTRRDAHNLLERPVENDTEPLEVLFKATLQQVIDVVSLFATLMRKLFEFFGSAAEDMRRIYKLDAASAPLTHVHHFATRGGEGG